MAMIKIKNRRLTIQENIFLFLVIVFFAFSCRMKIFRPVPQVIDTLTVNKHARGAILHFHFIKGNSFNYPSFVFWAEDTTGRFIQTLFITRSVATGVFRYGKNESGKWEPAEKNYPAALPRWTYKSGQNVSAKNKKSMNLDAYTASTPLNHFELYAGLDSLNEGLINVFMEINQTWDWNEYWTNDKFPDDADYKTSCQPALVYKAQVNLSSKDTCVQLVPIGHSHYSGKDGNIYPDLHTITTALHIAEKITVKVMP